MSRRYDFSLLNLVKKDGLLGLLLDAQQLKLPTLRCASIKKTSPFNPLLPRRTQRLASSHLFKHPFF